MSEISIDQADRLRRVFWYLNRFMVMLFRLGLHTSLWGNGHKWTGWIMVVTHRGRRSGRLYRTPLNYVETDGDIYCTAGFGPRADWYRNIRHNSEVEVWTRDGRWSGVAEDVSQHPDRVRLMRQVLISSGFAAYLAGINPHRLSDEDLAGVTADYCLVRIKRTAARTGPDGPYDLAWIWPAAVFAWPLLVAVGRRLRHNSR